MNRNSVIGVALLALVIFSCGVKPADSPFTPAPDGPTFLYFYTEG